MSTTIQLTRREQEVADLLLRGKSNKQIAAILNVSEHTVEFHLTNIYTKLGVASRTEAIMKLGESPVAAVSGGLGISAVDAGNKMGDNEADVEERAPVRPDGMLEMKPSLTKDSSRPYVIFVCFGILALVGLVLLYAKEGLMETWADHICIACTYEGGPALPSDVSQDNLLPRSHSTNAAPRLTITQGTPLPSPRSAHTVTRLLNGKILIVGGYDVIDASTANAVIFDPQSGSFSLAAGLHTPRHDHTATLLRDGRVLVVGGYTLPQQWLSDAEIYDPRKDVWTIVPPHYSHGTGHTATVMKDGRVLVVGGCIGDSVCTERVEIFDPRIDSWEEAAPLAVDRAGQTAQLLKDGRVLVAGGSGAAGPSSSSDALLYDPTTNRWVTTGPMISRRSLSQSTLLQAGRVLVVGGEDPSSHPTVTNAAEIYDPASNAWTAAMDMKNARWGFSLISLSNGRVLAIGGANAWDRYWDDSSFITEIELYDPVSDSWNVAGDLPQPVASLATAILPGNRLWVTGGQTPEQSWDNTWLIKVTP